MYDRFQDAVGPVAGTGSCALTGVLTFFEAWPGDEVPSPGTKGLGSNGAASSGSGRGSRSGLGENGFKFVKFVKFVKNGFKACEPERRSAGADS